MSDSIISPYRGYNFKRKRYRKPVMKVAETILADLPEWDRDAGLLRRALRDQDRLEWQVAARTEQHTRRDFYAYVAEKMGITVAGLLRSRQHRAHETARFTLSQHVAGYRTLEGIAMALDATKAEQPATPPKA